MSKLSKLSLQYSPILGLYIVPEDGDFYTWQFYLFLREGYYKDSKIKGSIVFDKTNAKKIKVISFLSPVFHPLVNFKTGELDLKTLLAFKNHQKDQEIFTILMLLKEMFKEDSFLSVTDSFNAEASKIYHKSEMLFIEKVFETTVIPSQEFIFDDPIREEEDLEDYLEKAREEQRKIQKIKEKLKQVCPNSVNEWSQISKTFCQNKEETIESKVKRFMQIIIKEDFV